MPRFRISIYFKIQMPVFNQASNLFVKEDTWEITISVEFVK